MTIKIVKIIKDEDKDNKRRYSRSFQSHFYYSLIFIEEERGKFSKLNYKKKRILKGKISFVCERERGGRGGEGERRGE